MQVWLGFILAMKDEGARLDFPIKFHFEKKNGKISQSEYSMLYSKKTKLIFDVVGSTYSPVYEFYFYDMHEKTQ